MASLAVIQLTARNRVQANLAAAARRLERARADGAAVAILPENFAFVGAAEAEKNFHAEVDGCGPLQDWLGSIAARLGLWIVGGTIPLRDPTATDARTANACLVYDAGGARIARYDKIHLFDVSVPGTGLVYGEARLHVPGERLVTVMTPVGRLGLSVCYDLRFPEMFRRLVDEGAEVLVVPAAFTAATGRAHWEPLLRARAIENLCYVAAAGQWGRHPNGRATHGDSMIVDHWGRVLARLRRGGGVVHAEIDLVAQRLARAAFPALAHRREASYRKSGL